ncbi:MAG TPA: DUF4870 domain-containing protein [Rhodocyclaceae bacterium]|jgi:uncharacterized membrane protein|nr:DUF4870 domain-containing protein [Rhodocyclaceae bacterium]
MTDSTPQSNQPTDSLKTVATAGYALLAAGFITGGLGYLIAVVLAYVKRDDARGTRYEEHLRWQINTFWGGCAGFILGCLTWLIIVGMVIIFATAVWMIYRIIKGWLALYESKPLYFKQS